MGSYVIDLISFSCSSVFCISSTRYRTNVVSQFIVHNTLIAFDTVAAALTRGSPSTGSLCKTTAGSIGSTSRGSEGNLSVTATTSVTATIPCSDLTAAVAYTVTVNLNRYTAGGGSFVDTIQDTIEFVATGTTENIEYEVPVNTDYDYEIQTGTATVALAP